MRRPRIVLLTNYPADLASFSTGVETAAAGLLEGLRCYQDRFDFHVASLTASECRDRTINRDGFQFHFLAVPRNPVKQPHLPYNVAKAYLLLQRLRPDLVHCMDNLALAAAATLYGRRRLFTVHGIKRMEAKLWRGSDRASYQSDRVLEWWVRRGYRSYIVQSPYAADSLPNNAHVDIIPNAVVSCFFANSNALTRSTRPRILFVGPLVYLKQPHVLLAAYELVKQWFPDVELDLCGAQCDPRYVRTLRDFARERSLRGVNWVASADRNQLRKLMETATVLVVSSLQENSPMVIAEAMALGLPVIASRVGGIPYMIEDGETGLLFQPGGVSELVERIRSVLTDQAMRGRLCMAEQERARRLHHPTVVARQTVAVYERLLNA